MKWDAIITGHTRAVFDQAAMEARQSGEAEVGAMIAQIASDLFMSEEGEQLVSALMVASEAFGAADGDAATGMEMVDGRLKMSFQIEVVPEGYVPTCDNPEHDHSEDG